jgi:hypothetical protein
MKTKNRHELLAEQQEFVKNVLRDPVLFATHFLGVELWESEVELLRSIQTNRRTAIRVCHAVGKTFTLAVAALWCTVRYDEGIVLTTSPTQRKVRTQLWSEIHRQVEPAKVPYPPLRPPNSSSAATIISRLASRPTRPRISRAITASAS